MVRKLFITVHGVGEQRQFDTVKQTATQVVRCATGEPGPKISLGMFASGVAAGLKPPPTTGAVLWYPTASSDLGFSEVYWADISRAVDLTGFRMEEGVPWAQTLVDKVKARKNAVARGAPDPDFELIRTVIGEMGDGLELLDWLTALAPKLKLPTFNLSKIVNAYLGDVQLMAEFKDVRELILCRWRLTMDQVSAQLKDDDEIYLITHSEGTVVTLIGLLLAMSEKAKPAWLDRVRGWMTIGSPIDKHLVLWPELWHQFEKIGPVNTPVKRIAWWNYCDYGDPIGFRLDTARQWMRDSHAPNMLPWANAFQFETKPTTLTNGQYQEDPSNVWDLTFSRYKWPGQAHLDYWTDNELFNHFLGNVAGIGKPPASLPPRWFEKIWSYVVPYLLALIVLTAGIYFLDTGIWSAQGLKSQNELGNFASEVAALTFLLAGTTVLARMPRIVREKGKFAVYALVVFTLLALLFWIFFPFETEEYLLERFQLPDELSLKAICIGLALLVGGNAHFLKFRCWQLLMNIVCGATLFLLFLVSAAKWFGTQVPFLDKNFLPDEWQEWVGLWLTAICLTATLLWTVREKRVGHSAGIWPLIGPGFTAIVGIGSALALLGNTRQPANVKPGADPELWPFFLGAIAFLFLWKLAVILFDLTFIWHRYIKQDLLQIWFRRNLVEDAKGP